MILPIKYTVDWELICQQNKTQINKDNIRENRKQFEHDYKVVDKVMLTKHTAYKYETPYTGTFLITQCFEKNVTVNLQYGTVQIKYNVRRIKPYESDTTVEDISSKICLMMST